jgi:DNA-binding beta-propeller fold protein YncE
LKGPEISVAELSGDTLEMVAEVALTRTHGSPRMALSHDSRFLYVVGRSPKSSGPELYEIDLRTPFRVARVLSLPEGDYPGIAVHCASRKIFLSDSTNQTIWVVNRNYFSIQWQIRLDGGAPGILAMSAAGDVLYALSADHTTLWVIDPNGNRVLGRLDNLEGGLGDAEPFADGSYLYVSHWEDGRIVVARVLPKRSPLSDRRVFAVDRKGNCRVQMPRAATCLAA